MIPYSVSSPGSFGPGPTGQVPTAISYDGTAVRHTGLLCWTGAAGMFYYDKPDYLSWLGGAWQCGPPSPWATQLDGAEGWQCNIRSDQQTTINNGLLSLI